MRILKKKSRHGSESRIRELESTIYKLQEEINQLKKSNTNGASVVPFPLFIEIEKIDFLIFNTATGSITSYSDKLYVIPDIPLNINAFKALVHPDDALLIDVSVEKLKERPFIQQQARIISEKDGTKEMKPAEIVFFKNISENDLVIISIKDISQLAKQRKELVKTRERVEESDKLKSSILLNISHQIRTPLNSITGFSELLANSEYDSAKRKEYIEIIKQQSRRILGLIDDISEIAKLENGNIELTKIPCNLKLILKELLIGLNQQRTIKQKEQVDIKLDIPDNPGLEIMTDSGRLQQAILNIINYSLRYTQKGYIQFGYRFDEQTLKITFFVIDTSNGLTKDEQKVIFNKFSVIDTTDGKMEDPGLGLTISKNIIKSLGGKIWVESEEGKGNTFLFNIPFEPVPDNEHVDIENEIGHETTYQWPNKRILIVDDEEVNAMFLDAVLQGTSAQVIFAKNGNEAIELCKSISGIDLVLMDLKMPVMNGLKATQEIRKYNTKIPIIAQTALASEEDKHNCLKVGCNDIITKPIEVQELMLMINRYICD
ncbi:MAG: response regulator [Bacteroidales bacterium]|nr:response regulator [Bacteroidales bacterium]